MFDEKLLGLNSISKPDTVLGRGTCGEQRQCCCPQEGNHLGILDLVVSDHPAGVNVATRQYSQRRKRNLQGQGGQGAGKCMPGRNNEARRVRGVTHWRACCRYKGVRGALDVSG